jgi:hypothetical protein
MNTNDAFTARMLEQVWQIINYQNRLEQEGRLLSIEEAALEWIDRYAAYFPPLQSTSI